jgi:hypothetical protein
MYCSSCGNQIAEHLNYCNSCGARIEKNPLIVGNSSQRLLTAAAGSIGVVGLICFVPLLQTLLQSSLTQGVMITILVLYLATVFLMFSVLIGHVWKHSGDIRVKGRKPKEPDEYMGPASLRNVATAQLESPREPAISVTEHTTRTLDEVPFARNSGR